MLKNIKSLYFIKLIFVYIDENQKLKILKYNKSFQKNIDIGVINYKLFNGKYIIFGSNRIGKEYYGYGDQLSFKGEYTNKKRNGKGKEYHYNGKIKFEGEYLNGKRNGKGKEYFYDKLIFEGEFLNDKEWIGTRYDANGKIAHILQNNANGTGFEYWGYGIKIFEGEYLNGQRNGKGKEYYWNGKLKFEGQYLKDLKWNGKGYDPFDNDELYELINGKGLIKEYKEKNDYFFNLEFIGDYLNGKKNGKGKEYNRFTEELEYECEYINGKKTGKGKEYYENGEIRFEGEFLYDYRLKGKLYINKKLEYEGEFLYNKKWNGKGYDENCNIIYELKNGKGTVKEYDRKGKLIFEGYYLNGKRNGTGKEYDYDGKLIYVGEYLDGKRIKKTLFGSCINI